MDTRAMSFNELMDGLKGACDAIDAQVAKQDPLVECDDCGVTLTLDAALKNHWYIGNGEQEPMSLCDRHDYEARWR